MIIHVVQEGETIYSIALLYGVSLAKLIEANGLIEPYNLAIGQSLVILVPEITYTVKEGDCLESIANQYGITLMELYQNNPILYNSEFLYPGEVLIISYNKIGKITTHGNTVPYINIDTLKKTLPYLTYLSILNYTATDEGEIVSYYDDTSIIQITKDYGVMPLMLLTTLSLQGEANIRTAYDLLLNDDFQNKQIDNILTILKEKGYYGVNYSFEYINISNIKYYNNYFTKLTERLNQEGYLVFAIINPNITIVDNEVRFARVDLSALDDLAYNVILMNYQWAKNTNPPGPISSINSLNEYLNYIIEYISPDKLVVGIPTIGYDWELPYSAGISSVTSLTLERAQRLAYDVGATIHFDESSQTPYFNYFFGEVIPVEHVVWFIDARSITALLDLVPKYNLLGSGIWNITVYNPQIWSIINALYDIDKVL